MAIDSLGSNPAVNYTQLSSTSAVSSGTQGGGSTGGVAPAQGGPGGKFADAIAQALSQVEGSSSTSSTASTSSTSSTTASGSTQDPQQAEAAFAQSLFTALQSQAGGSKAEGQASGQGGGHHHHHGGGGGGKISSGLQSLASQLTSTGSDSNSSTTASPALTDLQSSFNNLLAANGQSGSSASLPQFLQTLSQNLQGAPSSGNVVSTKA